MSDSLHQKGEELENLQQAYKEALEAFTREIVSLQQLIKEKSFDEEKRNYLLGWLEKVERAKKKFNSIDVVDLHPDDVEAIKVEQAQLARLIKLTKEGEGYVGQ